MIMSTFAPANAQTTRVCRWNLATNQEKEMKDQAEVCSSCILSELRR